MARMAALSVSNKMPSGKVTINSSPVFWIMMFSLSICARRSAAWRSSIDPIPAPIAAPAAAPITVSRRLFSPSRVAPRKPPNIAPTIAPSRVRLAFGSAAVLWTQPLNTRAIALNAPRDFTLRPAVCCAMEHLLSWLFTRAIIIALRGHKRKRASLSSAKPRADVRGA